MIELLQPELSVGVAGVPNPLIVAEVLGYVLTRVPMGLLRLKLFLQAADLAVAGSKKPRLKI